MLTYSKRIAKDKSYEVISECSDTGVTEVILSSDDAASVIAFYDGLMYGLDHPLPVN
jgi:hypothetical protein